MLVLGIDPGSITTGYGLVEKKREKMTCIHSGIIRSSSQVSFHQRIYKIYQSVGDIIERFHPDEMAIEDVFYAKNVKSALKIGHARAAALIAAAENDIGIFDYTPLEIKKSVVGYGKAPKEQVQAMVKVILGIKGDMKLDTSDALAAAICHLNWARYGLKK